MSDVENLELLADLASRLSAHMRKMGWDKTPEWYAVNRVARSAADKRDHLAQFDPTRSASQTATDAAE